MPTFLSSDRLSKVVSGDFTNCTSFPSTTISNCPTSGPPISKIPNPLPLKVKVYVSPEAEALKTSLNQGANCFSAGTSSVFINCQPELYTPY